MTRGRGLNQQVKEADELLRFLKANEHPDVFRRGDLKSLYDSKFCDFRRLQVQNYAKIPYNFIFKELKQRKVLHELGDYVTFGHTQELYEYLLGSEEHRETLAKWKEEAKVNTKFCEFCGVDCQSEKNLEQHKNGARHRIHSLHYQLFRNRDQYLSCPSGIEISSDPPVNSQTLLIEKECDPGKEVHLALSVQNTSPDKTLIFRRSLLLWDTGVFRLMQKNKRDVKQNHHINPGESYDLLVRCKAPADFGHHFVPCAFYFDWKDRQHRLLEKDENTQEFVVRYVSVHVLGDLHKEMAPTALFEYPHQLPDFQPAEVVKGVEPPKSKKSLLSTDEYKLKPSRCPTNLKTEVAKGLTGPEKLPDGTFGKRKIISNKLKSVLDTRLTPGTYKNKFDHLLWIEELQMCEDIKRYDLLRVEMGLSGHLLELEVPGLMERRPSVLRGDKVLIYMHGDRTTEYQAFIYRVERDCVLLGGNQK